MYRVHGKLGKALRKRCSSSFPGPHCLLSMCTLNLPNSAMAFGAQTSLNVSQMQPPNLTGQSQDARSALLLCRDRQGPGLLSGGQVRWEHPLAPLPPHILVEAELCSQRYWPHSAWGAHGGALLLMSLCGAGPTVWLPPGPQLGISG